MSENRPEWTVYLETRPERQGGRQGKAPTFAREPPGLRANADAPAVLVVLGRSAQVVPGTLGTDTAQVRSVSLDAFVNSLLLEKNQRVRAPSEDRRPRSPAPTRPLPSSVSLVGVSVDSCSRSGSLTLFSGYVHSGFRSPGLLWGTGLGEPGGRDMLWRLLSHQPPAPRPLCRFQP